MTTTPSTPMRIASLLTWVALAAPLVSAAAGGAGRILAAPSVTLASHSTSHPGDYVVRLSGEIVSGTLFQWTVHFDTPVSGFTDCSHCIFSSNVVCASITSTADSQTFYVNTYSRPGDAGFSGLVAGAAHDTLNPAAVSTASVNSASIPYHPTLAFTGASTHNCDNMGTITVNIKTSSPISSSSFTSGKVSVTGVSSSPSFSYDGQIATLTVHPDEAAVTFSVADGAFFDGPSSIIGGSLTVAAMCIPAVASFRTTNSAPWHDTVHPVSITVTFLTHIDALQVNWFTVVGGTLSNLVAANAGGVTASLVFTFDATPTGNARMEISLAAGQVHALASSGGQPNPASPTFTIYSKIPYPMLAAVNGGGRHGGATGPAVFLTVMFLMPVTGFTQDEVQIDGAVVTGWFPAAGSLSNMQWTISFQPTGTDNVVVYIPGGACMNAADHSIFNAASVDLSFYFQTQVGLLAISSVVPDSLVGTAPATLVLSGDSPTAVLAATLPVYKYATAVTVNLVRQWDTQFASSSMAGGVTVEFTSHSLVPLAVVIAGGDPQTVIPEGKFQLTWSAEQLADSIRSFTVLRSDWVSSAHSLLAGDSEFYLTMKVVNADTDTLCLAGGDTSGCDDNGRFFVSGVETLTIARAVTVNPPVTILSTAAYAQHFSSGSSPPPPNNGMYSQDRPVELLIFERTCAADASSLSTIDQKSLWTDMTELDTNALIVDVIGAIGLRGVTQFDDVTSYFTAHPGSSNSWGTLSDAFVPAGSAPVLSWQGADCGVTSRRFVLLRFVAGSAPYTITQDMQSYVTLTSSLLRTCTSNTCTPSDDFTAPAPAIIFTLHNDPTRTIENTVVQTRTAASGFYMSSQATVAVGGGDQISFDIGFELMSRDVQNPPIEHQLYTVVVGDEIPVTKGRLSAAVLTGRCSNIPSNFEDLLLLGGTATKESVYDALFGNGAYPSGSTLGPTYSMTNSRSNDAFEPFYPNPSSADGLFATSWEVVPFTTVGSIFYSGDSGDAGRVGLKITIRGTWSQFSSCMTSTHTTIAVSTQDLPNGVSLFNIPITVTEYIAGGTPADRIIARRSAPDTIVMTLQAPSMTTVSQASTISRGILVTVFDVASTVVAGTSSQAGGVYGQHFMGHTTTSGTATNNVYRAIQVPAASEFIGV